MKPTLYLYLWLAAVCAGIAAPTLADAGATDDLKRQWAETVDALKSYSAQQRDEAVASMQSTLDAMDAKLDEFETWTSSQWNELTDDARVEKRAVLRELRQARTEVAEWYGALKHGSSDTWEQAKHGLAEASADLGDAYQSALDVFEQ